MSKDYDQGFGDGLREAARTLRKAADDHDSTAELSKKVLESHAHQLASALFRSWANGIEMNADNFGYSYAFSLQKLAIEAVWENSLVIESSVRRGDEKAQYDAVCAALGLVKSARDKASDQRDIES